MICLVLSNLVVLCASGFSCILYSVDKMVIDEMASSFGELRH